jgi:hypothetical protein
MSYDRIDNLFGAKAAEISKRKAAALAELRKRTDLNDQGRRQHQDRIEQEFADQRRAVTLEHADQRADRREELMRGLHRIPGSQTAANIVSLRSALADAEKITDGRAARTALRLAQRTGDDVMARAIGIRALNAGWGPIVNEWADTEPSAREALDEIQAIDGTDSPGHRLARSITGSLGMPPPKAQGDGSTHMNALLRHAVGVHTEAD